MTSCNIIERINELNLENVHQKVENSPIFHRVISKIQNCVTHLFKIFFSIIFFWKVSIKPLKLPNFLKISNNLLENKYSSKTLLSILNILSENDIKTICLQVAKDNLSLIKYHYKRLFSNDLDNEALEIISKKGLKICNKPLSQFFKKIDYIIKCETRKESKISKILEKYSKNLKAAINQQQKERQVDNFDINSISSCSIYKERHKLKNCDIGIAFAQGRRPSMEDAHLATKLNILGKEFKIFGIFDGHGGANASIFVKSNLTKYLSHYLKEEFVNTKNLDIAIYNAFKSAFYRLDYDYKDFDGTTATVAVIVDNTVYTANAGDSRTLIIDGQNILQLSEDAKPDISKFSKRIHKRGGYITPDQITNHYGQKIHEIPRVNGCLAVASSIGDKKIKGFGNLCCVPARPKITKYQPKQKNFQLVLACDGLFDVATTNTVGQNIQDLFKRNQSVENIAEKIVNAAYTAGSSDNISTMVVKNYS